MHSFSGTASIVKGPFGFPIWLGYFLFIIYGKQMLTWTYATLEASSLPCPADSQADSLDAWTIPSTLWDSQHSCVIFMGQDIIPRGMPHKNSLLSALRAGALIKLKPENPQESRPVITAMGSGFLNILLESWNRKRFQWTWGAELK